MSIKYLKDTLDSSPSFKTNEANGKMGLAPNLSSERISVLDSLIKEGVVAHEEILEEVSINPILQLSLAELFGAEPEELSQEMNLLLFEVSKDAFLMKSELLAKSVKESRFDLTKKVINEHAFEELSSDLMEFNLLKVKQSVLMPLLGRFQSTKLEDRSGFIERELTLITNGETKLDLSTNAEGLVEKAVTDLKRELEGKKADVSLLVSDIATGSALDRKISLLTEKYGSSGNEKGFRENVAVALASLAYTDEDFRNKAYGFGFVDSSQIFNAGFTNLSLSDITPKSISIDGLIHKPEQDSSMFIGGVQKEMDEYRYLDEQIYKKQLREAELSFLNNGAKKVPHFSLKNKILNIFNERDISLAKEIKLVDKNGRLLMAHSGDESGSAYTRVPDSQLTNPKVLSFAALKAREAGVNPVYIHPPTSDGVSKAQKAEFVYMATKELLKLGYGSEEIKLGGMLNKKEVKNGMNKAFAEHKAELEARSGTLKSKGENNAFNNKLKSQSDSAKMNTEIAAESSSKKNSKNMKL